MLNTSPEILLICVILVFPGYLMTILVSLNLKPLLYENKLFIFNLALFCLQNHAATLSFRKLLVFSPFYHVKY